MATASIAAGSNVKTKVQRADLFFYFGCSLCGTWVLGLIGAPILLYCMYLMRQAQLQAEAIRPWSITIVGGLILVDHQSIILPGVWTCCPLITR